MRGHSEHLRALRARIWTFTIMNAHVNLKAVLECKMIPTHRTRVVYFTAVQNHMLLERLLGTELFLAGFTLEVCEIAMRIHVIIVSRFFEE